MTDLEYEKLKALGIFDGTEELAKKITDFMLNAEFLKIVASGNLFDVMAMLGSGRVDVNAKEPVYGRTALMVASDWGHFEIVKYLVENGANVNLKDKDGKTALDFAETNEIRQFLINNGVKNESFWSKLFK